MRVLYVCSDFGIPPAGTKGASIHVRAITRGLHELGHEVRLLSPRGGMGDEHPVQHLQLQDDKSPRHTARRVKTWIAERGLDDGVGKEVRALLHAATAASEARRALSAWTPDAIIERLSLFSLVGVELAETFGCPLVVEVNAVLSEEAGAYRALQLRRTAEEVEAQVLEAADAVVAVSQPLADRLTDLGTSPQKVHVVPNGVDLASFDRLPGREECRRQLGLDDAYTVGFVGSLRAWHGVDVLLRAFAGLQRHRPTSRLVIVGTDAKAGTLKELARTLRIEHAVRFVGAVPHDQVPIWLRAMDVATAPYPPMDRFYFSPIKLFEYMASGTCIVASRIGQIEDIVEHDVSAALCAPGDEDDLCRTLHTLQNAPEVRRRLAGAARSRVEARYTWTRCARTVSDIISEAAHRRRCKAAVTGGRKAV